MHINPTNQTFRWLKLFFLPKKCVQPERRRRQCAGIYLHVNGCVLCLILQKTIRIEFQRGTTGRNSPLYPRLLSHLVIVLVCCLFNRNRITHQQNDLPQHLKVEIHRCVSPWCDEDIDFTQILQPMFQGISLLDYVGQPIWLIWVILGLKQPSRFILSLELFTTCRQCLVHPVKAPQRNPDYQRSVKSEDSSCGKHEYMKLIP